MKSVRPLANMARVILEESLDAPRQLPDIYPK